MTREQRILVAGLLQASPFMFRSLLLRDAARYDRTWADLYERLVPGEGRLAVLRAEDAERQAKEAEDDAAHEAARAARVAEVLERWNPSP